MSVDFEQLADAALPPCERAAHHPKGRSTRLALLFLILVCVAAPAWIYYSKSFTTDLPEAARILLSVDTEEAVLPHVLDDATEFAPSLDYLKRDVKAPALRLTDEGRGHPALVRVEPRPSGVLRSGVTAPVQTPEVRTAGLNVDRSTGAPGESVSSTASALPITGVRSESAAPVVTSPAPSIPQPTVSRDWGGTVLVPDGIQLAKAYTSDVSLARVEAHPIDGERLRVWARIKNLTNRPLFTEVGCEFRGGEMVYEPAHFVPTIIPKNGIIDVYFASARDRVRSYTILVRRD